MDVKQHVQREQRLKAELGEECFNETVGVIKEALCKANLDSTPTILEDLLQHVKVIVLLDKI